VPSLAVQGADDEYGTLAQLDAIEAKSGSTVERRVLASCRHSPQRDQPEAVLAAISSFIGARP
jgi:pimeloyl-ACP methyl ester carboxylesterase